MTDTVNIIRWVALLVSLVANIAAYHYTRKASRELNKLRQREMLHMATETQFRMACKLCNTLMLAPTEYKLRAGVMLHYLRCHPGQEVQWW